VSARRSARTKRPPAPYDAADTGRDSTLNHMA
jgi:hypothetical protein